MDPGLVQIYWLLGAVFATAAGTKACVPAMELPDGAFEFGALPSTHLIALVSGMQSPWLTW